MTVVKSLLVARVRLVCELAATPVSSAWLLVEIVAVVALPVTVSDGRAGALLLIAARIGRRCESRMASRGVASVS
jgi:hypothetical protein